jgi:hypothetical protein
MSKLTECNVDNCPGLLEEASESCVVCQSCSPPHLFYDNNLPAVRVS